jgi:hypothetical protein
MRFAYVLFAVLICSTVNAQNKIDAMLKPPPAPTDVSVVNFPDVQTVGGTVNVGNLPLDIEGAVRVSSAPARQMVWYDLITEPISVPNNLLLPTAINTNGYSTVGVFVIDNADGVADVFWQWADDESFAPVEDSRNGFQGVNGEAYRCGGLANARFVCSNTGGNVRVRLRGSGGRIVTSVRVYLIP